MTDAAFPETPYSSRRETRDTLHRFAQVVGKVRLAAAPRRNHWWNVPFHLTGRGLTTRPMGRDPVFAIDFDLLDHRLDLSTATGVRHSFSLPGLSVAAFHARLLHALEAAGVEVSIAHPYPFDLPDSGRPFADDTEHAAYDPARALPDPHGAVLGFWDSAHRAGARRSSWDYTRFDCPGGVTDPRV